MKDLSNFHYQNAGGVSTFLKAANEEVHKGVLDLSAHALDFLVPAKHRWSTSTSQILFQAIFIWGTEGAPVKESLITEESFQRDSDAISEKLRREDSSFVGEGNKLCNSKERDETRAEERDSKKVSTSDAKK